MRSNAESAHAYDSTAPRSAAGLISAGVVLAVMGEGKSFSGMGFLLVMMAATASGLRWTLTQYYMTARQPTRTPVVSPA